MTLLDNNFCIRCDIQCSNTFCISCLRDLRSATDHIIDPIEKQEVINSLMFSVISNKSYKLFDESKRSVKKHQQQKNQRATPENVKKKIISKERRKMAVGKLSAGLSRKLWDLQRGLCPCCEQELGKFHMDHIMPISLGGTNTDDNIQLLRQTCNLQKGNKHPIDFMQERGFLL